MFLVRKINLRDQIKLRLLVIQITFLKVTGSETFCYIFKSGLHSLGVLQWVLLVLRKKELKHSSYGINIPILSQLYFHISIILLLGNF